MKRNTEYEVGVSDEDMPTHREGASHIVAKEQAGKEPVRQNTN